MHFGDRVGYVLLCEADMRQHWQRISGRRSAFARLGSDCIHPFPVQHHHHVWHSQEEVDLLVRYLQTKIQGRTIVAGIQRRLPEVQRQAMAFVI